MKEILGPDIGVSSIGWAIFEESSDGEKNIENLETTIITLSTDKMNSLRAQCLVNKKSHGNTRDQELFGL